MRWQKAVWEQALEVTSLSSFVLVTVRSVCPFCSGGRDRATLKEGKQGLVQVLCRERVVATCYCPCCKGESKHRFWAIWWLCLCCRAEPWPGWAAWLLSSDVVTCPSLALNVPVGRGNVGMCYS